MLRLVLELRDATSSLDSILVHVQLQKLNAARIHLKATKAAIANLAPYCANLAIAKLVQGLDEIAFFLSCEEEVFDCIEDLSALLDSTKRAIAQLEIPKSRIVYRVIRDDEDPALGLSAKNPNATYTPDGHVRNGGKKGKDYFSQYISTTASVLVAREWAEKDNCRIVEINLGLAPNVEIIDFCKEETRNALLKGISKNFASSSKELLVVGYIPPEAIGAFVPRRI